ncbi:hypothetical protein V6C27_00380 [Peptococcaceae bacterium 1198_IL3148]
MIIFGLTVLFLAIIAFQVPTLIKKQMWRDLISFSVLMVVGIVLSFSIVLDISLPNPLQFIAAVFTPVTQYFDNLFG